MKNLETELQPFTGTWPPVIMAIDPGIGNTGYAVIRGEEILDMGTSIPNFGSVLKRIDVHCDLIDRLIIEHNPHYIVIEGWEWHGKVTRVQLITPMLIGAFLPLGMKYGKQIHIVYASKWGAQLTGYNHHGKDAIGRAITYRLGGNYDDHTDHAIDALGMAIVTFDDLLIMKRGSG